MSDAAPGHVHAAADASFVVGATDVPLRHTLHSALDRVSWWKSSAVRGETVRLAVETRCVGDGAPVVLDVLELSGRRVWRAEGAIAAGRFQADVSIPADLPPSGAALFARVTLPRHGLEGSSVLEIVTPFAWERLAWSRPVARPGEAVRVSAELAGSATTDSAAGLQVYRSGPDGADEPVGPPFAAAINRGRLDAEWVVPGPDTLAPRVAETAVYFRLMSEEGIESVASPLLHVEVAGAGGT